MGTSEFSGDGYESIGKGIYYTPEISLWLNAKSTRENHRKMFFKKIDNLREDITKYKRPRRARAKIIPSVEAPVYTIRLENADGIRILFDYKSHTEEVDIFVIAVSNKKEFQSKLKKSSEHIVHASSFDRLKWNSESEELDLENCTDDELMNFKQKAKQQFDSLPEDEKSWTVENMEKRTKRAAIYNFCLPNIIDISTLIDNEDFIIPQILKLQEHQKELMDNQNNQFLLEGVAGTGKTTILLYRFVSDVKNYAAEVGKIGTKTLFVTHNKKLKDDILLSLKLFFPDSEIEDVSKCVKTIDELFKDLITDKKDPEAELENFVKLRSKENPELNSKVAEKEVHDALINGKKGAEIGWTEHFVAVLAEMNITLTKQKTEEPEEESEEPEEEKFPKEKKLTREKFRMLFRNNNIDVDLFYEEYRGLLRGYNLNGENRIISKEKYMDIGRRRGRLQKNQRKEFYSLAKKIESELKGSSHIDAQYGEWDNLDLCKEIIARINENKILCDLEYLYVDEVQDLTAAEIEVLLTLMNKNDDGKLRIAMAGDLSQSIQPSSFTWQALSDVIYDVLDIKVDKEKTLVENFRSTPYLVWAANHILELQRKLDGESTTELQRPYADENYGEPGLIFFASEKELAIQLATNNLPNAACPMLVRDEIVKQKMKTLLPNNHHFVETIAKFKGLEKKNVLLWQPDSGSECELDLREDPNRGKEAKKKEYSDSTALLELRHMFVGFTRARYLMGICAPKDDKSFFLKKVIENCESIEDADISKLTLFDSEIEPEDYVEFAREYENAGHWGMAAESFRNCGSKYEHNRHYCLGMEAVEKGEWISAINCFSEACLIPGEKTTESRHQIAEYSKLALNENLEREARSSLIAKILHNAETQLSKLQRNRLNAERSEERRNWSKAATYYIDAKDFERARFVIEKIEDENTKIRFLIEIGDEKKAMVHVKEFISKQEPKIAISIALGVKKALDGLFKGKLAAMRKHFETPDISWARTLAKSDEQLLKQIEKQRGNQLLKRENLNRSMEYEVFKHLIKTKNNKELDKRKGLWRHLDRNIVTLEQFEMQNEKKYFLQALQTVDPEWKQYEKYLAKFKKMFPQKSKLGFSIAKYFLKEKIKFEMKSNTELSQEIWTYSILAETIRLNDFQHNVYINKLNTEMQFIERKTSSMISTVLILLFEQKYGNVDRDILLSADIIASSLINGNKKYEEVIFGFVIHYTINHSKYNAQMIRNAFNISMEKRNNMATKIYKAMFIYCYVGMKNPTRDEMRTIVPYQNELTRKVYYEISMVVSEIFSPTELKDIKKYIKSRKKYLQQQNIIKRSDFGKFKAIKRLSNILSDPIFENIFSVETPKKETSPELEEALIEEPKSIEEVIDVEEIVEDEVLIMDEEFDDIDFSEIINENKENIEESIQFNSDDIAELDNDVKGENHVDFFEEKLKEKYVDDNMEYAKLLIDYSDFSFRNDCGFKIHLRFALMIAINNEANKLRSLPEPIYIFQKSDEERRRLFMSEPRNKEAIIESGLIYSHRIFNQNL